MELIMALDGPSLFTECVLGLPGCGVQTPCPLHAAWVAERQRLEALFNTTTLATLAVDLERLDLRLKELAS
jgi:DNA-binding IscR family transcriptional regulator